MRARPTAAAGVNARAQLVVDYAADPHQPSWGVFLDALKRVNFLPPAYVGADPGHGREYQGTTMSPQRFSGLGELQVTGDTASIFLNANGSAGDISDASTVNAMGDPVRRQFAERLRRRQVIA